MRKDLSICSGRSAAQWGAASRSPLWSDAFYSEVEKMGGKRWDTSSLLARLQR